MLLKKTRNVAVHIRFFFRHTTVSNVVGENKEAQLQKGKNHTQHTYLDNAKPKANNV